MKASQAARNFRPCSMRRSLLRTSGQLFSEDTAASVSPLAGARTANRQRARPASASGMPPNAANNRPPSVRSDSPNQSRQAFLNTGRSEEHTSEYNKSQTFNADRK